MKTKPQSHIGVQELCRKLKDQLDELAEVISTKPESEFETQSHLELMEQLKRQLQELSR